LFSYGFSSIPAEIGAGFHFSSKDSSGAVLALPEGGSSSQYFATHHLNMFIKKHSKNWFSFVKKVTLEDHDIQKLSVIVGVHHTKSWALASYSSESSSAGFSLKLKVGAVAGVDGGYDLSWESSPSCSRRVCKAEQRRKKARQNQAIFIKSVHVTDQSRSLMNRVKDALRWISQIFRGKRRDGREDINPLERSGSAFRPARPKRTSHKPKSLRLDSTESSSRPRNVSSTSSNRNNPSEYPGSDETDSAVSICCCD
jgi:hypothetical protein